VYGNAHTSDWRRIRSVIGQLPSDEIIQGKYLKIFAGLRQSLQEDINLIQDLTGRPPNPQTVDNALEGLAAKAEIERMSTILELVGGSARVRSEPVQTAYRLIAEHIIPDGSTNTYWCEKLTKACDFFTDVLGVRPDKETSLLIYSRTLGQKNYSAPVKSPDGQKTYPPYWEYLMKKFGKPDPEVVQRLYLAQLPI
jgi:hypothetical protein